MKKILILIFLFCMSTDAFAGMSAGMTISEVPTEFSNYIANGFIKFQKASRYLFLSLAVISLVWNFGQLVLKGAEISSIFFEVFRSVMIIGFFWWLIMNVPTLLYQLFENFADFGKSISGLSTAKAPAQNLIDCGLKLFLNLCAINPVDMITGGLFIDILGIILGVYILVVCVMMALNIIIMAIEFQITCYAGLFILGMAGASWTREYAIAYLRKLLGQSLSYYGIMISLGVIQNLLNKCVSDYTNASDNVFSAFFHTVKLEDLAVLFIVFLISMKILNVIPNVLSGLVGGGSSAGYNAQAVAGDVVKTGVKTASAGVQLGLTGGMSGFKSLGSIGKGIMSGASNIKSAGQKTADAVDALAKMCGVKK